MFRMFLPDGLLLSKIAIQNVYCDRSSLEKKTGKVKPKYKIAGNVLPSLKIYTFFVGTSNSDACEQALTVVVEQKDWEGLITGHLSAPKGYFDIKKIEAFNDKDLLAKMRDGSNGFPSVARLCDAKFQELKQLGVKAHQSHSFVSTEKLALIKAALEDVVDTSSISDEVIRKLGL